MTHLVLVYGSLRQGHWNNYLLEDSEFLGTHNLRVPFFMVDLGSFPALIKDKHTSKIMMELYAVDDVTMDRLDQLEGYPHFYGRTQLETEMGPAWVYFLNEEPREWHEQHDRKLPVVESGNWTTYLQEGAR